MNKSDLSWMKQYNILKSIYDKNGNCYVKKSNTDKSFYSWTCRQRMNKKDGLLKKDREMLLEEINFDFNESWEEIFNILKEYLSTYKEIPIPKDNCYYPILGKWVDKQLNLLKHNRLTKDKVIMYESIGLNINRNKTLDDKWFESYMKLKSIYDKTGNCDIPNTIEFKSLYRFVQTQRSNYKNNTLSVEKIELLSKINFRFDLWFSKYLIAKEYYINNGNLNISKDDRKNSSILNWIYNTRSDYNKNKLSEFQIEKLKEINFPFEIEACEKSWLNKYYKAKTFFKKNNHCNITPFNTSNELFSWATEQAELFSKNKLSNRKIALLLKINFNFDMCKFDDINTNWMNKYKQLYNIFYKYKHYYIDYSNKSDLLAWITELCNNKNSLSSKQLSLLNAINFDFTLHQQLDLDDEWLKKYSILKRKYKNTVITPDICSFKFFIWVKEQYALYKNKSLNTYKLHLLNQINFDLNNSSILSIDDTWIKFYKRLQNTYNKSKTNKINPFVNPEDLFKWALKQNILISENKLSENKILLLEKIDFDFNISPLSKEENEWLKYYKKLKSFKKNYGHLLVDDSDNFKELYLWIDKQNYLKKHGLLRDDFSYYLNKINFKFTTTWDDMFYRLKIYYNLYKSINIPTHKHLQYKEIDLWLKEQISLFKKEKLPDTIVNSYYEIGIDLNNID